MNLNKAKRETRKTKAESEHIIRQGRGRQLRGDTDEISKLKYSPEFHPE